MDQPGLDLEMITPPLTFEMISTPIERFAIRFLPWRKGGGPIGDKYTPNYFQERRGRDLQNNQGPGIRSGTCKSARSTGKGDSHLFINKAETGCNEFISMILLPNQTFAVMQVADLQPAGAVGTTLQTIITFRRNWAEFVFSGILEKT